MNSRLSLFVSMLLPFCAPAFAAPPANDIFADAIALTAASGTVDGTTVDATREAGEPDDIGERSVWWKFTVAVESLIDIETTRENNHVAVFQGGSVSTLVASEVAFRSFSEIRLWRFARFRGRPIISPDQLLTLMTDRLFRFSMQSPLHPQFR